MGLPTRWYATGDPITTPMDDEPSPSRPPTGRLHPLPAGPADA